MVSTMEFSVTCNFEGKIQNGVVDEQELDPQQRHLHIWGEVDRLYPGCSSSPW